jgi:hypothetical protein
MNITNIIIGGEPAKDRNSNAGHALRQSREGVALRSGLFGVRIATKGCCEIISGSDMGISGPARGLVPRRPKGLCALKLSQLLNPPSERTSNFVTPPSGTGPPPKP